MTLLLTLFYVLAVSWKPCTPNIYYSIFVGSLSDTVRDYGSMSTNSHTKSLPLPINTSPPTQNGASLTPARPVTPPPTQNGASLTPARPVTPPPTQNRGVLAPDQPTPSTQNIDSANRDRPTITPSRELPTRSQIITDPSITTNRRKKMQCKTMRLIRCTQL